jgi:hypothetical protein
MAFNVERILRIFSENGLMLGVINGLKIADNIYNEHCERVITVENNARDAGKLEGYEKGYKAGKMDSEEYERGYNDGVNNKFNNDELVRLTKIEDKMETLAPMLAGQLADNYPELPIKATRMLSDMTGLPIRKCYTIMKATRLRKGL